MYNFIPFAIIFWKFPSFLQWSHVIFRAIFPLEEKSKEKKGASLLFYLTLAKILALLT